MMGINDSAAWLLCAWLSSGRGAWMGSVDVQQDNGPLSFMPVLLDMCSWLGWLAELASGLGLVFC